MKSYFLISCIALVLCAQAAHGQGMPLSNEAYCQCIEQYAYEKHYEDFYTSGFKCFRAWKKDMKRKKKECQAKAIEKDHPMAARRKRREAERKMMKRDKIAAAHDNDGRAHDYWY